MSKEKLLQANINKLLVEKHEARKTIEQLKARIAELEIKPKKKKNDNGDNGHQDSKIKT